MESRHLISTNLSDFSHLGEFVGISSDEIEEGQSIKILRPLIRNFDNLRTNQSVDKTKTREEEITL